jgi:TPR repeat protein
MKSFENDVKQYERQDFTADSTDHNFQCWLAGTDNGDAKLQSRERKKDISMNSLDSYDFSSDGNDQDLLILLEAAQQGHPGAQNDLGICYLHGEGVTKDDAKAVYWYRKAAEQGIDNAQFVMGFCCYHGIEMTVAPKKAVQWFTLAAEQNNTEAFYYLGECFHNGFGVEKDTEKAIEWYKKASDQGHTDAAGMLDILCPTKPTLSFIHMRVQPDEEAAECGNEHAQFILGNAYYYGETKDNDDFTGIPKDRVQACLWYRQAAEQGYAPAQNNLGCCYYSGWGVTTDDEKAVYWFRKAAEQGNADARYNLSICYEYGYGLEKDRNRAEKLLLEAAGQGNTWAKIRVYLYEKEKKNDDT